MRCLSSMLALLLLLTALGCTEEDPTPQDPADSPEDRIAQLNLELRGILEREEIKPLVAPPKKSDAQIKLGQALFFDRELSGHRDTSCVTCHRPTNAMVDGIAIPAGTTARIDPKTGARLPGEDLDFLTRNVPDLFNRGQEELTTMFWDRRVAQVDVDGEDRFVLFEDSGPKAPGRYLRVLPRELDNVLAAQNMLPVLNRDELRGAPNKVNDGSTNELSNIIDTDLESVWNAVMRRLMAIEGYRNMFRAAYPEVQDDKFEFFHAANAISAFLIGSLTFFDAPWDDYVAGKDDALDESQLRGALLFYGKGRCSSCHTGALFTDQEYHNIGVTPLTRGPDRRPGQFIDRGVAHTSQESNEKDFHFKTPALRNVELTGPYMHNGTVKTLENVIWHKDEMKSGLWAYDVTQLRPEFRSQLHNSSKSFEAIESNLSPLLIEPLRLTPDEVDDLVAFLKALTSPSARDLTHLIPESVPSELDIEIPEVPKEDENVTPY